MTALVVQGTLFEDLWRPGADRPKRPMVRAACDKGASGHGRYSRSQALEMPYIEPNVTGIFKNLIITDRDKAGTETIAFDLGMPTPTWVAMNHRTGAGHIIYALRDGVPLTDAARRPPVNYLARIEHGMVSVFGGDPAYTGALTKNPLHLQHQPTLWGGSDELPEYGLKELAAALDKLKALPKAGNPKKTVQRSCVGRNCALFDDTRQWAYKAVEKFWGGTVADWERATFQRAYEWNETIISNDFTMGPLSANEVGWLAASVAGWVWKRFTPASRAAYLARNYSTEKQAERGRKSGEARRNMPAVRTPAWQIEALREFDNGSN